MIQDMMRRLSIAILCACLAACGRARGAPPQNTEPPDGRVKRLADTFLDAYFDRNPETATVYGVPGRHHDKLTDNSLAAVRAWEAKEDGWLVELKQIDS